MSLLDLRVIKSSLRSLGDATGNLLLFADAVNRVKHGRKRRYLNCKIQCGRCVSANAVLDGCKLRSA